MFKDSHLTRQLDLIPMEALNVPVHIIGAGAIGSFTALMLAKMGIEDITVYDPDKVSIENMSCQFYRFSDIDQYKVDALHDLVYDFTEVSLLPINRAWKSDSFAQPGDTLKGIIIAAADNMEVRRALFEHCKDNYLVKWFIDSRMGAESCLLYTMNPQDPKDQESYAKTLYTNEQAVQERCTAKSTIYTANMLSGHLVKTVKNLITGASYPRVTHWSIADNAQTVYTGESACH